MQTEWRALRAGQSAPQRRRELAHAHELFLDDRTLADDPARHRSFQDTLHLRQVVFESWLRARQETVDPIRHPEHLTIDEDRLTELRATHPITRFLPVVRRLLLDVANESGLIVAIGDAAGRLLWVDGNHETRARAEDIGFTAGVDWSEQAVGTSAPGSALRLGHAIQVLGAEHYNRHVHEWSCSAAPVRDPITGALLGVIDVSGSDAAVDPHVMPLLEATLAAVEAELTVESLRARVADQTAERRPRPKDRLRLLLSGRDPALLEVAGRALQLSRRHAEMLLALSRSERGLSANELLEQVHGERGSLQTLRSEMVRLRRWLSDHEVGIDVASKPYRLVGLRSLSVDADELLSALSRGAHRVALASYEGELLPGSAAPVVELLRAEVSATLRESMLQGASSELLFDYACTWASDDAEVWETLLQVLPQMSPKRARVVAHLAAIG